MQPWRSLPWIAAGLAAALSSSPVLAQVDSNARVEVADPTDETPIGLIGGSFLGVRGSRLDFAEEEAVPGDSYGIGGQALFAGIITLRAFTLRGDLNTHVGGGVGGVDTGLDGRIAGGLSVGLIGHLAQSNGLFVRVGVAGAYDDNDRYHFSHVDLPSLEAGWQLHLDNFGVEIGARGGAALATSYEVERHIGRELDTVGAYGGYATLSLASLDVPMPGLWLDVAFMRHEDDAPLQFGTGRLCGGWGVFACFDGRLVQATFIRQDDRSVEEEVTTVYLGLSLGFGGAFALGSVAAANQL